MSITTRKPTGAKVTGIYARISKDRADGAGVQRQQKECHALAKRKGWPVAEEFVDNSIGASAFTKKSRPRYAELLKAIDEGRISRVVCFKLDRLYRRPRELEDLIDRAEQGRVEVVSVHGGDLDLNSGQGQTMARVAIAMAAGESKGTSERLRSQKQQRRERGLPHSHAFGWRDAMHPNPQEKALILAGMDDVVTGRSLNDIARAWTKTGIRRGKDGNPRTWTCNDVGRVLSNPRHAGQVVHGGKVVGDGVWTPIVDRVRFEEVVAAVRGRSNGAGVPRRRSMLTGLVRCGVCDTPMVRSSAGSDLKNALVWRCAKRPAYKDACGSLSIRVEYLEPRIVEACFQYVDGLDLAALISDSDPNASARSTITRELTALDKREDQTGSLLASGKATARMVERATNEIRARRDLLQQKLGTLSRRDALSGFAGRAGGLRAAWPDLTTDQRRNIIAESLHTVTVMPSPHSGRRFDPSRVIVGQAPKKERGR
jgi:site-specific DNA recombinase